MGVRLWPSATQVTSVFCVDSGGVAMSLQGPGEGLGRQRMGGMKSESEEGVFLGTTRLRVRAPALQEGGHPGTLVWWLGQMADSGVRLVPAGRVLILPTLSSRPPATVAPGPSAFSAAALMGPGPTHSCPGLGQVHRGGLRVSLTLSRAAPPPHTHHTSTLPRIPLLPAGHSPPTTASNILL